MAYFPDLSPYTYFKRTGRDALNVGWLDPSGGEFPKGATPDGFNRRLAELPTDMHTRGWHTCPYCSKATSTCEIRVTHDGVEYAAPKMIVHYVEAHGYLPPQQFIDAVMQS